MATVYKAIQEPLNRQVAIKMLKPTVVNDKLLTKRFEREAMLMASLQHENVMHVHDFIRDRGTLWIVMDYIEGIDLFDLLERVIRLPPEIAAMIALQVARALDYAHFRGIIHRDIKPANVMISYLGEVKLMDFGIARGEDHADLTETGTGVGTPSYMSPEQIIGDKVDFRSDVFSLGILLYQMVTGRKPFVEDSVQTVMQKIRLENAPRPQRIVSAVPRALERIILRCLEKVPERRFPTTQALIDDLNDFLAARVETNYNVRLIIYLRDIGILSDEQVEAALGDQRLARKQNNKSSKNPLWRTLGGQLTLLSLAVLCGLVIQSQSQKERFWSRSAALAPATQKKNYAWLKVSAEPWATIAVDGRKMFVTPSAEPIALGDGVHDVSASNPYFGVMTKRVHVKKGQTLSLHFRLKSLKR
jgi:serine/threonine protein kinase